jgi:negative regulator of sigma-B (phosphoserine phosphatase)
MENLTDVLLTCGVAVSTQPGQEVQGDRYLIQPFEGGTLVALIDGLGHGEEAAEAAALAARTIAASAGESILNLIRSCHDALRGTRGVVMSLASFSAVERTMVWAGVGNVEGLLLRADRAAMPASEMLLLRSGVVGRNLPPLSAAIMPIAKGDTLILASDGVGTGFWRGLPVSEAPQRMSERILTQYATGADDATVVTARYCG